MSVSDTIEDKRSIYSDLTTRRIMDQISSDMNDSLMPLIGAQIHKGNTIERVERTIDSLLDSYKSRGITNEHAIGPTKTLYSTYPLSKKIIWNFNNTLFQFIGKRERGRVASLNSISWNEHYAKYKETYLDDYEGEAAPECDYIKPKWWAEDAKSIIVTAIQIEPVSSMETITIKLNLEKIL